jgi:hypothetical protein
LGLFRSEIDVETTSNRTKAVQALADVFREASLPVQGGPYERDMGGDDERVWGLSGRFYVSVYTEDLTICVTHLPLVLEGPPPGKWFNSVSDAAAYIRERRAT